MKKLASQVREWSPYIAGIKAGQVAVVAGVVIGSKVIIGAGIVVVAGSVGLGYLRMVRRDYIVTTSARPA